ncbi:exported protein of unknown function [Nitrosotalea devaniterrae]|uniref:Uncharacterized protein n=1 Tax=Nitrosotalea devaniterrae TaxID=1078905 RepID=A0A128A4V5_9ARCH|nr:exported protein of unknown function [Candidatus Nitrosotalea devanaterra]
MKNILLLAIGFGMITSLYGTAWATTDLGTLGSPSVTISPASGPPGTKITITVSNIPDISKTSYPYPDLYIYLPFSQPFGTTLTSHCGGQDCFPIYTHDEALNHDVANRIITFSLPSTNNSKPVFLNGYENSVCDVIVNGKILERFSTLCNTKDEPQGLYQIKLAWVLESDSEQSFTTKTVPFFVTPAMPPSEGPVADNGDTILKQYQNGTISEAEFYAKLKARGWTEEQVRQALAVIGKLPHQMGVSGPDYKLPPYQTNSSTNFVNATSQTNTTKLEVPQPEIKHDINSTQVNVTKIKTEQDNATLPIKQNSSTVKPIQTNPTVQPPQSDSMWNGIIIGLSVAAAAIMAGVTIFVKTHRSK